jgi:hypothetical protein
MPITVVNPMDLVYRLQAHLQEVDALLPEVGNNAANIQVYDSEGDLAATIANLKPPAILIYWDGVQPSRFPSQFKYQVALILRLRNPAAAFVAICQGKSGYSAAEDLPMLSATIHPRFHPMELPSLERQQIAVSALGVVFEVFVMKIAYSDKSSN